MQRRAHSRPRHPLLRWQHPPSTHSQPRGHHGLPSSLVWAPAARRQHRPPLNQAGAATEGQRGGEQDSNAGEAGIQLLARAREEGARRGPHQGAHGPCGSALSTALVAAHPASPPSLAPGDWPGPSCSPAGSEGTMRACEQGGSHGPGVSEGTGLRPTALLTGLARNKSTTCAREGTLPHFNNLGTCLPQDALPRTDLVRPSDSAPQQCHPQFLSVLQLCLQGSLPADTQVPAPGSPTAVSATDGPLLEAPVMHRPKHTSISKPV